ncbi:MAG: outer membrane protein assembly factor BamA [Rickettsiales bacterium]|jgi:outer membrane protein insertion porin family|nr:outer membrane protein assembly factor BamA [Rickettsiales bacterium]
MKKIFILFISAYSFLQANTINNIIINGSERVDKNIIETYLKFKTGMIYNDKEANETIKALYKTKFFEEVNITNSNGKVTITVVENPLISDIIFEGNDVFKEKSLLEEITTKKKTIFNKNNLNNDVKRILNLYKKSGKFNAKVEPQMIKEDMNRIKLIFKIDEGKTTRVKDVVFIGNKKYSSKDLKDSMRSVEYKWYKFGLGSKFDPDNAEIDKELLRRFYYSKGYPDFEVISVSADVDIDNKWVYLTFFVSEGERYKFNKIEIHNNIEKADTKKLEKQIKIKKDKIFNSELLQTSMDGINRELAKEGFVFVEITPDIKKNDEEKTIDVTFVVQESPRMYIGEIKIIGNMRTHDDIIRKELRFGEGDPLNMTDYHRSIELLYGTGYFDRVDIKMEKTNTPDKLDLIVSVNERRTGELSFGVGYSTVDGMNTNIGVTENNLLGKGQSLGIRLIYAQYSRDISLNYGKPNFLQRDLFAGISLFHKSDKDKATVNFNEGRLGTRLYVSYAITDYIRQQLFYNLYKETISNVSSNYSGAINETTTVVSSIGHTTSFDSRDNGMNPESGWYISLTSEFAGVGGDNNHLRNTATLSYYIPVIPTYLTLKVGGFAGVIGSKKQKISPTNSFFLSDNILRGFKYGGIGPRIDGGSNSAIGGKKYYTAIAELKAPILSKEYGLFAGFFINTGTLTETDVIENNSIKINDSASMRSAAGVTIYWTTPMGLLNLTFSKILKMEDYDKPQEIAFGFGSQF